MFTGDKGRELEGGREERREGGRAKDEKGDGSNVSPGIRPFARKDGSGCVPYLSCSDTRMLE